MMAEYRESALCFAMSSAAPVPSKASKRSLGAGEGSRYPKDGQTIDSTTDIWEAVDGEGYGRNGQGIFTMMALGALHASLRANPTVRYRKEAL